MRFESLFSLHGKNAVITGGAKGIGEMIAAGFLAHGAKVYITSRTVDECNNTAKRLSAEFGAECIAIPGDVSDSEGIKALVEAITAEEDGLHILVNNAGTSHASLFAEFPEQGWDEVMDLNVKTTFFLTQGLLPLMKHAATDNDPARVINIGSIGGMKCPKWGNYSYGASKAAVHHLTRQLASHLAKDNILVNAIAPGPFPTTLLARGVEFARRDGEIDWSIVGQGIPRGRVGTPEDIAGLAIYLSSRAGAFTVGATITCDGGAFAQS
jgi:2-deoxy-D-gluconate 3-dehydrogenase